MIAKPKMRKVSKQEEESIKDDIKNFSESFQGVENIGGLKPCGRNQIFDIIDRLDSIEKRLSELEKFCGEQSRCSICGDLLVT